MKRKTLLHFWLLLLCMIVGGGTAWAADPDLTLDFTSAWTADNDNSDGEKVFTKSVGTTTYMISGKGGANFKFNGGYFFFGKSGAYVNLPKVDFDVEKIEVVGRSGASGDVKHNIFVGTTAVSTEVQGLNGTTSTFEIATESQAANTQYVLKVTSSHNAQITYIKYYKKSSGGGDTPTLSNNDLALTGAPITLSFDLYNNSAAQVINYTTSSTGAVTVSASDYIESVVNETAKTITVTPKKKTSEAKTITISQAADNTYKAGSATFTVTIDDTTPKTGTWEKADLADLTEGDVFVIVGNNGNNYAMSNGVSSSNPPSVIAIDIENDEITSEVADNIKWNISGNATDGYTFYPNEDTKNWLYCTNTNNGVRVGTNDNKTFKIDSDYLYHIGTSRYVGIYQSQDWRCYTTINTNITGQTFAFYKYVDNAAAVKAPVITVASEFVGSTTATITCATEGATIYYSFDNTTWTKYTAALTINATTTIYAKAIKGNDESKVVSKTATKKLVTPTVTIDKTGITSTDVYSSTAAGSLSATVTYNETAVEDAAVTWSGNNDQVATINASTGAVTLVAAGTVTFTATFAGNNDYNEATATYEMTVTNTDPNQPGTENNPYTVAEARAAIDAGTGLTDVYATGIISQIDSYNSNYNSITYWISDDGTTTNQLEVYSGKGLDNANFTSKDDIAVGATVVVYGTLKKYGNTYEFDKNNYLKSYTAPTVAVEAPTFSPEAGTYAEAQAITISCETQGATIYYTTDGTEPTNTSTKYTQAITVSTATNIKAIAYLNNESSTVASATYHICSTENPYTVAQALAFSEYPANEIYVHGIVSTAPTQAPTNNGELTYYISVDGEASNQLQVYKGKGLEQAAFTKQDDIQVGDIVTIYGNVKIYNNTTEFDTGNYLVAFERPVITTPVINASDVTLDYDATSGEIAYTIDNPAESVTLEATTDAEWISNIIVTPDAVTFTTIANEGEADRTATFTLTYEGAEDKTVTVTQKHFVVDYATLPFSWDDKTTPTGITNNGVGTYNTKPYLKFDTTGDYIILKTNERPGILTFDIKGNSFSDGTFTVQTSEDGVVYTDLETYTELGDTKNEEFDNLGENVRYIKWIYTEKVNGNVALGNINLAKYEAQKKNEITGLEDSYTIDMTKDEYELTFTATATSQTEVKYEVTNATMSANDYSLVGNTLTVMAKGELNIRAYVEATPAYKEAEKNFTVTVLGEKDDPVIVLDDEVTLVYGKTYTIDTDLIEGGEVTVTSSNPLVASVNGLVVTAAAVGKATIIVATAENDFYKAGSATFELTVTEDESPEVPAFYETFDRTDGEGGRDGVFSGSVGSSTKVYDNEWKDVNNCGGAYKSLKFGTGSANGTFSTTFSLTGEAVLFFSAAGWATGTNTLTITLTGEGDNLQLLTDNENNNTTFTLINGQWTEYNATIMGAEGEVTLTFSGKRGFIDDIKVLADDVQAINVTLANSGYASYCSPVALDLTPTDDWAAWSVTNVDETNVTFTKIEGAVPAKTPFIIYGQEMGGKKVSLPLAPATYVPEAINGNWLEGTLSPTYLASDNDFTFFGLSGGKFVKMKDGVVKANKAYLPILTENVPEGARLNIVFADEATGIKVIDNSQFTIDNAFFDLQGRRIQQPTKGLYIKQGKKLYVK